VPWGISTDAAVPVSRRPVPGTTLSVSAIGLSLDPAAATTPDSGRTLAALVRAARARGVTLFDLPEGPGADRLERTIATALPRSDPDLTIIAQRSTVGIEADPRPRSPPPEPADPGGWLARSIDASNRRLAPHRIRLIDWIPTEGDDRSTVDASLEGVRASHGIESVVRRISPGSGPAPGGGPTARVPLYSGGLSLLDTRLLRWLAPGASDGRWGFFARDPLGSGRLDGSRLVEASTPRRPDAGPVRVRELEREFAPVLSLGFLTDGRRRTLAQASLRFVLRALWVCSAIVPMPAPERLDEVLRAESVPELTDDEVERLQHLTTDR
jgi:aryl-alcohol dehydrogenase-like predicted oxidoreductase